VIILLLVPALYLVLEDLKSLTGPATNKPVITGEEAGFQEGRIAEA
jgi:hypothetical protein